EPAPLEKQGGGAGERDEDAREDDRCRGARRGAEPHRPPAEERDDKVDAAEYEGRIADVIRAERGEDERAREQGGPAAGPAAVERRVDAERDQREGRHRDDMQGAELAGAGGREGVEEGRRGVGGRGAGPVENGGA